MISSQRFVLITVAVFVAIVFGCNQQSMLDANDDNAYREIAWEWLTEPQRATVIGDRDAAIVRDDQWQGQNVVSVTFSTTDDALLGPLVVFIDPQTKKVVGAAPRF
jgi:hypothetical protein